jgi:hypothetical protein
MMCSHETMSRFSRNVSDLLCRIRYEIPQSPEARNAIYKLRYDANLKEQSILANAEEILTDRYDDSLNAFNVGVLVLPLR